MKSFLYASMISMQLVKGGLENGLVADSQVK